MDLELLKKAISNLLEHAGTNSLSPYRPSKEDDEYEEPEIEIKRDDNGITFVSKGKTMEPGDYTSLLDRSKSELKEPILDSESEWIKPIREKETASPLDWLRSQSHLEEEEKLPSASIEIITGVMGRNPEKLKIKNDKEMKIPTTKGQNYPGSRR